MKCHKGYQNWTEPKENRLSGEPRYKLEYNFRIDLKEIGCACMAKVQLAEDINQ